MAIKVDLCYSSRDDIEEYAKCSSTEDVGNNQRDQSCDVYINSC